MCKEADTNGEEEDVRIPEGIPEPGQKPPPPENPLQPPKHLTKFSNQNVRLEGREELPDLELSEVSNSKNEDD